MIIIAIIISIFFIIVIVMLCRSYTKDIFELENRILQLEKRINKCEKSNVETLFENKDSLTGIVVGDVVFRREGESDMACKKGRGGRKK